MRNIQSEPMPAEPSSEDIIIRLFRCMKPSEKTDFIQEALAILGRRFSFDRHYKIISGKDIQEEIEEEDLEERLFRSWPPNWPKQEIVELDNLGDAGAWLKNIIGEPLIEVLFGDIDIEMLAEQIGEDYLGAITEEGLPLPSDFKDSKESVEEVRAEDEEQIKSEFLSFLLYWREFLLQTLEKQNPSVHASGPQP